MEMPESMGPLAKLFKGKLENFEATAKWCPRCQYLLAKDGSCTECAERALEAERQKRALYEFNVKRLGGLKCYEDYTEAKLDSKYYDHRKALSLMANYPNENLYIWGDRGVGKTHLGVVAIRRHPKGKLLKPYDILRTLRALVLDSEGERRAIATLVDHPCLMIDDLGTEKLTEHAASLIYEIVDGRDMGKKRGLLITSNYGLAELSAKMGDDRVASRLSGMCRVIRLTGKDRRPENNER
jgi:DNA replication protein DnaC